MGLSHVIVISMWYLQIVLFSYRAIRRSAKRTFRRDMWNWSDVMFCLFFSMFWPVGFPIFFYLQSIESEIGS